MNEKLLELLNQINAQKQKVVDLANSGTGSGADRADSRAVWSASSKHQQKSCDS